MAKNDCLYLPESTRGSYETINAAVMYKLGLEPQDNSFPLKLPFTTQINTNSNMGSRVATFTKGPAYMENIQATYIPVNALPEYRMLGACTTADGVHTITTAAVTVAKPSLTMFRQGQATTEKWKVAGAVSNSLTTYFKQGQPETAQEAFDSITDAVTTDTPSTSPVFPSDKADAFNIKSTFTINSAAYNYEEISWGWSHPLSPYGNNSGKRRAIIDTGPIIITGTFHLIGDVTALRTLQAAGTGSTVVSKLLMAANTAYYKQYSLTMYIVNMSDNFRLDDGTDRCVVTMIGSDPTITCKDGVSQTFYGEEA